MPISTYKVNCKKISLMNNQLFYLESNFNVMCVWGFCFVLFYFVLFYFILSALKLQYSYMSYSLNVLRTSELTINVFETAPSLGVARIENVLFSIRAMAQ